MSTDKYNIKKERNKDLTLVTYPVPYLDNEITEGNVIITTSKNIKSKRDLGAYATNFHTKGDLKTASKYYQKYIDQGFDEPEILSNYAMLLKNLGNLTKAELIIKKAIKIKPDFAEGYYNLSSILLKIGRLNEAKIAINKSLKLKPNYAEGYCNLGIVLNSLGDLHNAELSTRKAIEICPEFAEAYSNLANILFMLERYDEAKNIALEAIKIKPNFSIAYLNLGGINKKLCNIEEAELATRKAIELGSKSVEAYTNLGAILHQRGRLNESKTTLYKAIEIDPNYSETYYNLACLLSDLGELNDSITMFKKAINIRTDYLEAYLNLGMNLKDNKKLDEAEFSTRKAIEINPNSSQAYSNLAVILADKGNLKEAAISLQRAIEIQPDYINAYFNLATILIDLGRLHDFLHLAKDIGKLSLLTMGDSLRLSIHLLIVNLILGDFSETNINLNTTKKLIKKGGLDLINEMKNKRHAEAYFKFIDSLFNLLNKTNQSNAIKFIPHLGESHCLSFSHQKISIFSETRTIQPVLITGAKIWHFASKGSNKWKASLSEQIKNHRYSDEILISFGEIDCRLQEGILNYTHKYNKDHISVCKNTIIGYLNFMENKLSSIYHKRFYLGVPAPYKNSNSLNKIDIKQIDLIRNFNTIMKYEVLSRGSYFLDIYSFTVNNLGFNNELYMCDNVHLSPSNTALLFQNFLISP